MRWKELAWHLYIESSQVLQNFCGWVEGEIEELEEAGPLSAQHKKIKRLVKERAAQHERNEQHFTKNSVIANWREGAHMPLLCAHVHLCLTQVCATYLPGKCSLSGRVSTTKFTKLQGGRGSQACANAFSSALVSA